MADSKLCINRAEVLVLGTGEAFDRGLGNTAYLLRGKTVPTVLFDCGYQIPERVWNVHGYEEIAAVCFTHLHADHSFGIVPLLVRFREEKRDAPLVIFGPPGTDAFVRRLLELGYPGSARKLGYELEFRTLDPRRAIRWKGLKIRVARTTHSVLNYTIRVDLRGGTGRKAASFAISGDGQITSATQRLVCDVDLLCQEVYAALPGIPVHSDLESVAEFVTRSSRMRAVGVTHCSRRERPAIRRAVRKLAKRDPRWRFLEPGDCFRML